MRYKLPKMAVGKTVRCGYHPLLERPLLERGGCRPLRPKSATVYPVKEGTGNLSCLTAPRSNSAYETLKVYDDANSL